MLEVRLSTWRLSPSSARAWQPRSGIQKSRRKRARRSSARCSRRSLRVVVVPDLAGEARRASLRVVDVALDLAGRDRSLRERAVGELDRVPAVLPALVDQAGGRVAAFVLDVAVAVEVAAVLDPGQRSAGVALERADERVVAGPAVVLVEEDEEQRRRVGASEVRRMGALAACGELTEAQLVQDLSGLLLVEVVSLVGLASGEYAQRRRGQLREVRERLVARDQAVATEQRHEPRQSCRGQRRASARSGCIRSAPRSLRLAR